MIECVNITIVDDSDFEGLESFFFEILPTQDDPAVFVASPDQTAVFINDPEDGMIAVLLF